MTVSLLLSVMVLGRDWAQLSGSHLEPSLGWQSDYSQAASSESCLTPKSGPWSWEDPELGKDRVPISVLSVSVSLLCMVCPTWKLQSGPASYLTAQDFRASITRRQSRWCLNLDLLQLSLWNEPASLLPHSVHRGNQKRLLTFKGKRHNLLLLIGSTSLNLQTCFQTTTPSLLIPDVKIFCWVTSPLS